MALLRFPNLAQTTLTGGGIGVGGASFTVASAAAFGAADFFVRVEHATGGLPDGTEIEFMRATNVAGSTFTVTKGLGGTADQAHAAGSYCTAILIGEALTLGLVQQLLHASGGTTIFTPGGATGGQGVVTFSDTPTWAGLITGAAGFRDSRGVAGANGVWLFDDQSPTSGASITIPAAGSLPTGKNIRIYWRAKTDNAAAQGLSMRFSGDSGNQYDSQILTVLNATVTGTLSAGISGIRFGIAADNAANVLNAGTVDIQDFAAALRHPIQSFGYRNDASGNGIEMDGGTWKGTGGTPSAITTITILLGAGAFATGSRFMTYIYS